MLEPITESQTLDAVSAHSARSAEQGNSSANLPDLLLVERARGKDARAFETLMRRYNQRLYRIARSILPDMDAAANVVLETYLLAFSDLERYEPTGKFGAWLARLAFNQALALRRTLRPSSGRPLTMADENDTALTETDAAGETSQAGIEIDGAHARELLEQAIDALPEVFRTVFVLRTVEKISGIETAACLGINETTVRTRLYRAQRRLRVNMDRNVPTDRGAVFELDHDHAEQILARVLARLNNSAATHEQS